MFSKLQRSVNRVLRKYGNAKVSVRWVKRAEDSWLVQQFPGRTLRPAKSAYSGTVEKLARQTNELGPQPLWEGYNNAGGPTRMPNQVRTKASMGDLYTFLVQRRRPNIVVAFGTAFGVSGMYFLAGIESNGRGRLLTFEVNDVWARVARANLSQIGNRFDLVVGTFEDNVDKALPQGQHIDLAFIDAIHTKEFVLPQLEIVIARSSSGAIILLDDINFSDSMQACWKDVSADGRFKASGVLDERVGIVELGDCERQPVEKDAARIECTL